MEEAEEAAVAAEDSREAEASAVDQEAVLEAAVDTDTAGIIITITISAHDILVGLGHADVIITEEAEVALAYCSHLSSCW